MDTFSIPELDLFLSDLDKNLSEFGNPTSIEANLETIIQNIIRTAERKNWIENLITNLLEERPDHPALTEVEKLAQQEGLLDEEMDLEDLPPLNKEKVVWKYLSEFHFSPQKELIAEHFKEEIIGFFFCYGKNGEGINWLSKEGVYREYDGCEEHTIDLREDHLPQEDVSDSGSSGGIDLLVDDIIISLFGDEAFNKSQSDSLKQKIDFLAREIFLKMEDAPKHLALRINYLDYDGLDLLGLLSDSILREFIHPLYRAIQARIKEEGLGNAGLAKFKDVLILFVLEKTADELSVAQLFKPRSDTEDQEAGKGELVRIMPQIPTNNKEIDELAKWKRFLERKQARGEKMVDSILNKWSEISLAEGPMWVLYQACDFMGYSLSYSKFIRKYDILKKEN